MNSIHLKELTSYDFSKSLLTKEKVATSFETKVRDEHGEYTPEFVASSVQDDIAGVNEYLTAFTSGKFMGESVAIKEALTTQDFPNLFYAATEILMMNRIVPQRVISDNLFTTIPYAGQHATVTIRTLGGVRVEEVAEGAEYPETSSGINDQTYRINLEVKKYGAKIAATNELMNTDNWGILGYTLASLADELSNKKEKLCMQMVNELAGYTLLDNNNPTNTPLGSATGRGLDGVQNGALGIDDIMNVLAFMQMRGVNVDTIIVHPFAWSMWARDPQIREVMLNSGVIYTPQGNAAPGWGQPLGQFGPNYGSFGSGISQLSPSAVAAGGNFNANDPFFGKLGISPNAYPNLTPFGSTFFVQPKFIDRPLKIVVSPFVPYYKISGSSVSAANGKYATNIIFADSKNCGIILQKDNPSMEEWDDIEREVHFLKVKEKYGLAMCNQGRNVAVLKNIVIDRTYAFENMNSVTLTPLTTNTALV